MSAYSRCIRIAVVVTGNLIMGLVYNERGTGVVLFRNNLVINKLLGVIKH